jgi:hypothetical protein
MLGNIKQRLLVVFEVARDHQRSGVPDAQPALRKFECFAHRKRGRSKDHGVERIEKLFFEDR